ncbi:Vps54-domain-containing protein [Westerdykella ornata]|uniref:Vacuolar protein sorting-associated protein 54 n=1 Tax=Westerdykella ornata TaxID=318751 RepID=A0A6A6JUY0_WESOR|nr:Vps54-domain-containing protein [Westerdykella ornata]KAF2279903.1 Vps54-domain-containing protein [Westerdykella ornata]
MSSPLSRSPRRSTESLDFLSSPPQQQTQFPFPQQHDWFRRASSASGRHQPRRGSTASSIHSVGGALDTSYKASMGAVREQGHNAISTLLQPPIVRTGMVPFTAGSVASNHRPPSTKDIPPVTLPNIPHVEPSAFTSYLSQIGKIYDAFQRAKAESENEASQSLRRDSKKDELTDTLERGMQASSSSTPKLSEGAFPPAATARPKRRMSGQKRTAATVTPLSTIPTVYFDENFRLENPRTFDIVSERSEVVRPPHVKSSDDIQAGNVLLEAPQPPGRKALATNAILQEKLSWYMDTVEVHLINSISTASTSFFAALGSLRELQSEASDSVAKIKSVREDLTRLDKQMAVGGLKIVEMKRRRQNLKRLADATDQLHGVVLGLSHCDEMVDQGDLEVAAARLGIVERLISGSIDQTEITDTSWIPARLPPTIVDLRRLRALEGVGEGIQQLRYRIGKGFEARFLETLLGDLREHVKSVSAQDTLTRWVASSQRGRGAEGKIKSTTLPAYMNTTQKFRHELRATLLGLSSSSYTNQASAAFRDAIVREMKVLIRRHLPSSTDDDAESMTSVSTRSSRVYSQQDKNSILARNIRAMDPTDAEEFFVNIFTDIGEALRRLSVQVKVLLDVTSGVTTPPPSSGGLRSPRPTVGSIDDYLGNGQYNGDARPLQEELMQAMDMSSLLGQAVDAAQTQITKLLKVRSEATASLPLDRFLRYFNLCRLFADECEAVSGRSGTALKGVVNIHITEFVAKFADIEKQTLIQAMDSDRWDPTDFNDADMAVLSRILGGMTNDPPEWSRVGALLDEEDNKVNGVASEVANGNAPAEKPKSSKPAVVDEQKYFVPGSCTVAIRGLDRFETLFSTIPSMTAEVCTGLCDYLKLCNSRLCQLILGAGARQSAGLKNITTKHLAIASQTLSFLLAILPYVRECARRHSTSTNGKAFLAEFDNVKRLLHDQQANIHEKLVDLLSNRAAIYVRNLEMIQWDEDTERDVSPNMETLTKETVTLHKVISKYLADVAVRMIMVSVFESYREQLGKVFKDAAVRTAPGKSRLLRDAELFKTRLNHIDGVGNTGSYLMQLVESKTVAVSAPEKEQANVDEPQPAAESEAANADGNSS